MVTRFHDNGSRFDYAHGVLDLIKPTWLPPPPFRHLQNAYLRPHATLDELSAFLFVLWCFSVTKQGILLSMQRAHLHQHYVKSESLSEPKAPPLPGAEKRASQTLPPLTSGWELFKTHPSGLPGNNRSIFWVTPFSHPVETLLFWVPSESWSCQRLPCSQSFLVLLAYDSLTSSVGACFHMSFSDFCFVLRPERLAFSLWLMRCVPSYFFVSMWMLLRLVCLLCFLQWSVLLWWFRTAN